MAKISPTRRSDPYRNFNFRVTFGRVVSAGFSEVHGLDLDATEAVRRGRAAKRRPRIVSVADVTLKRGVIGGASFAIWAGAAGPHRRSKPVPRRMDVTIALHDEAGRRLEVWVLRNARPVKWTGPAFNAAGGADVAIEELVLQGEGIKTKKP